MSNALQRAISVLMYTLPLKTALPFGYVLFYKFSFLKILLFITLPIVLIEKSLPFGGILLFIILFAGLVRNPKVPYFIRYNACQALLLEIALIIFSYFLNVFQLSEYGLLLFTFTFILFLFSSFKCLYGIEPELPLISRSARMQIF